MDVKDNLFDTLIEAVDLQEEKDSWGVLWMKAREELFSSMDEGHVKIILEEQKKIDDGQIRFRRGECHHFYMIVSQMIFFHVHSELHNKEKCPLFLPYDIGQRYIDSMENDSDMLGGICRECGYLTFGSIFKKCPYCESISFGCHTGGITYGEAILEGPKKI
jgi:hypothetical protein